MVKNGKPIFYDPPEVKEARSKLTAALAAYNPPEPADKAVRLVVKWLFPRTEKHGDGEYKSTRPDTTTCRSCLRTA